MQNRLSASLKNTELWLLGIGGTLVAINLTLALRDYGAFTSFYITFLFFITIYILLKEKYHKLTLESGIFSSCLGTLLILLVFINSTSQINITFVPSLLPLMSGFSFALLASGCKGLKQYRKELLILGFLTTRNLLLIYNIDISLITAKFSTAILWYTGFQVSRSGLIINLPTGSVEVYFGCSGIYMIVDILSLAVLFIFMFNLSLQQKILVPVIAATLGFIINGFRVSLMAILVAQGDKQAFQYWHQGDGSQIFSVIATLFFGCFCWFLLNRNERGNQTTIDSSR
ncbi:cyanoexosortase A [Nostoc sp.]|uniref:cyanoexosortase A n=1 Tax=Nostoc sp. TaxID=1180 RepID=UPI002FF74BEF